MSGEEIYAFTSKEDHEQFFAELHDLVNRYPSIATRVQRMHQSDPTDDLFDETAMSPGYDPASPVFVQGMILIVAVSNMQNYESIEVLRPQNQSGFLTMGMLVRAKDVIL